ncbi:MAG: hypothetical protein COZ18_01735 [Flexibacter sp. CG_4_10_14_3_um_filter_32_15]|nr:MAG: hypothetical protein COZ18_01735 [Flexibacter sp. CG_4_10_14_3_um_filter_32_15]
MIFCSYIYFFHYKIKIHLTLKSELQNAPYFTNILKAIFCLSSIFEQICKYISIFRKVILSIQPKTAYFEKAIYYKLLYPV